MALYDHNQGLKKSNGKETAKAYEAFVTYLELGRERTCARVAELLNLSPSAIERYSKLYNWQERAAAWDADQVRERFRDVREERDEEHRAKLLAFRDLQERRAEGMGKAVDLLLELTTAKLTELKETNTLPGEQVLDRLLRTMAALAETASNMQAAALGIDDLVEVLDEELSGS